jgi:hypothetical protein
MRKFSVVLAATALAFANATPVSAQAYNAYRPGEQGVGLAISGTSAYSPILIKYVGSSPAGGTVTVAANGDITLKTGPVGSSVADATTECPVSGGLGGVITVANAACDTLGEVVDAINASANWRAVIQDGLRSDTSNAAGNGALVTLAETSASNAKGLALAGDSTATLQATILLAPVRNDIQYYVGPNETGAKINLNPFNDSQLEVLRANATATGTGADTFKIYHTSEMKNQVCTLTASAVSCAAAETETLAYQEPGGTTGVNKAFDFSEVGFLGKPGGRVLVRTDFATTMTAVTTFAVAGSFFNYKAIR